MMTKFKGLLCVFWFVFLANFKTVFASYFHISFCTNASSIYTNESREGKIVFPSTTKNFSNERCSAIIHSLSKEKTQLTLTNLRKALSNEQCESSLEIRNLQRSYLYCYSRESKDFIELFGIIQMVYRATNQNKVDQMTTGYNITVQYQTNESSKCKQILRSKTGVLRTSGYPSPLHGECEWIIDTGNDDDDNDDVVGIAIELVIVNENHLNPVNNFIEIQQDGSTVNPTVISSPLASTTVTSSSTKLQIRVHSSGDNGIGVEATYNTYKTCKFNTGYNQLNFEPSYESCQKWNLTAPSGKIAVLSFTNLNIPYESLSCSGNYVEVWDGSTSSKYCDYNLPPALIASKGQTLVVTYRSNDAFITHFEASFISISRSSYKTNCFVQNGILIFKCKNGQAIRCSWQCDNVMQCSDRSDEDSCSDMKERWHKLQIFVVVLGSICSSVVIFCLGLVCFKKCIIQDRSTRSTRQRQDLTTSEQSQFTSNADLPSPPPNYFTNPDEVHPISIIRGTYFFGDEFSQSGIHNASLLGIPPPRYRSVESLHQTSPEALSIWQRGILGIPLVQGDCLPNNPPSYTCVPTDKNEEAIHEQSGNESILIGNTSQNSVMMNESQSLGSSIVNNNDDSQNEIGIVNHAMTANV